MRQHRERVLVLSREVEIHLRIVPIDGWRKGQPVSVVPVKMGQKDRPPKGLAVEEVCHPPQPGSRIEQEPRRFARPCDRHRAGVTAVAVESAPGCRGRAPATEDGDLHSGFFPPMP